MGSGSKFDSALSTRGGRANIVTGKGIRGDDSLGSEILGEMKEKGIKFSKDKIVFAARLENGNKIFLETGNANSGLQHIVANHGSQFFQIYGVNSDQLGGFLHDVVAKGKLVTSFRYYDPLGREGYRSVYYWKGEHVVVYGISGNGYISTAFVRRKDKFM